jgi:hypothetical protein
VPVTIIELTVDGDAEALARAAPFAASLTRGATVHASSGNASAAVDGQSGTAWLPDAAESPHWLELDLGRRRNISRAQIHFDEPGGPFKRNIALEVEYRDQQGRWASLWKGTSYSQIWCRSFPEIATNAVRITTNARAVRQFDLFADRPLAVQGAHS